MTKEKLEAKKKELEEKLQQGYIQRQQIINSCLHIEGAIAVLDELIKEAE